MTPDELGPLPTAGRSGDLQELSIRAPLAALPVERFQFRDERKSDMGVDGSLEVKIDGHSTNFWAQVQLKATDSPSTNADGSVSLRVEPSNVNYLLNGQSPLYILWIAPRNELRFLWARDERKRLDAINPKWMGQETITLRFVNLLAAGLNEIHDRVLGDGRLQRKTCDILARAATAEPVTISIDPQSLSVTDPDQLHAWLNESGLSLVAPEGSTTGGVWRGPRKLDHRLSYSGGPGKG